MNEHELERWAQQLGREAAERLDVETTARVVAQRLREQPAQRPGWIAPEWLRVAATLVLLLGAGMVLHRIASRDTPVAPYALDELHELTAAELQQVLATLDRTLSSDASDTADVLLDDLTPAQLQNLLQALET